MVVSESSARRYALDPDVRLMLEVRDDNAAAFEELVARYQGRLLTVLRHLVGNREQAEDLTQEVFLRVYRARKSYEPGAKFSTWLFTIANHAASNSLRDQSRRHEVTLQIARQRPAGRPAARQDAAGQQRPDARPAIGQGRDARHRADVDRDAGRAAADGGPAEQVRGDELRRDRRGHGDFARRRSSRCSRGRGRTSAKCCNRTSTTARSPMLEVHDEP